MLNSYIWYVTFSLDSLVLEPREAVWFGNIKIHTMCRWGLRLGIRLSRRKVVSEKRKSLGLSLEDLQHVKAGEEEWAFKRHREEAVKEVGGKPWEHCPKSQGKWVFWEGENESQLSAGERSRKMKTENVYCINEIEVTTDFIKSYFRGGMGLEGRLDEGGEGEVWRENWQQKLRNQEPLVPWLAISRGLFKPNQHTVSSQTDVFKALSLFCKVTNFKSFFHEFGEVITVPPSHPNCLGE